MDDAPANEVAQQLGRLRKAVLRQGHSLDLLRERTEDGLRRLEARVGGPSGRPEPSAAQVRAMMELAAAVDGLRALAAGTDAAAGGDDVERPRSLREGLDLLRIRVTNLQRSFDLRPIPAVGRPFDDRLHEARAVRPEPGAPDGAVLEELLPGYTLGGRVVRPAAVVVNRRETSPPS